MLNKRQMYLAALAAALIGAGGFAFAEKSDMKENDAVAVTKAQTSLIQAVTAAEQNAGGKAARAEFEVDKKGPHYEVEVVNGVKVFDVRVDAASGKVLSSVEDKIDSGDKEDKDD